MVFTLAALLLTVQAQAAPRRPSPAAPPNVVLLVVDDLGYADLGVSGMKDIPTPNMDRLVKEGLRFSDAYMVASLCAPSRAGLVTGVYPQRFGIEFNPGRPRTADSTYGLPRGTPTIAEAFKAGGYVTGLVGKWHLGHKPDAQPTARGFDEFFGFLGAQHAYQYDVILSKQDDPLQRGTRAITDTTYLTRALAREAVSFLGRHAAKPFFLYVPFNAVHEPVQADPATMARVRSIASSSRREFASMLVSLDDAIGAILAALDAHKLSPNTLVVFVSDNGGAERHVGSSNGALRGTKGQLWEGGIRVPLVMRWPVQLAAGSTYAQPVSALDIMPSLLAAVGSRHIPTSLDGVNLLPYMSGSRGSQAPHAALFWRMGAHRAVREGKWKLVQAGKGGRNRPALFDLSTDIGEARDVSREHPDVVAQLERDYAEWNGQMVPPRFGAEEETKRKDLWLRDFRMWLRKLIG